MSDDNMQTPKNVIVLLLDSLNRHELGAYGGTSFDTPNIDRLAARSLKFTNHHTGSLPCIPARHDILVGAWDFLWKPWGSIEIWEEAITVALRRAGVITNLITDHPHLFEVGGENFHTDIQVLHYFDPRNTMILREGMTFTIEPMITAGSYEIRIAEDEWCIFTVDSSLAAHFEHTVAITDDGPRVLTRSAGTSIVDAQI